MGTGTGSERWRGRGRVWMWGMEMRGRTEQQGRSFEDNSATINHRDGA